MVVDDCCLAAMLGQIGLPGGGFGFGWHYNGAGTPSRQGIILSGFSGSTKVPPIHDNNDYKATAAPFLLLVLLMLF